MLKLRAGARKFFTGVRLFLPLIPGFLWVAVRKMVNSTVEYWKNSQVVVDSISDEYMREFPQEVLSEYDPYGYWLCYSLASILYLVGWLAMAFLTVEAVRWMISGLF